MKAVVFREPGGPEKLSYEVVEDPRPGPQEVLLRVALCGVNPLDRAALSGAFPPKPMPHILGSEVGGRVEALGEGVKGVKKGQEVVVYNRIYDGECTNCRTGHEETCQNGGILGVHTQGGYAQYMVVPAKNVVHVPQGANLEACTAATLSGHTAWHLVLTQAAAAAGDWVAVYGATGGVGSYAVQLARLAGARVIAVTRDAGSEEQLHDLGADEVVVGQGKETAENVRRLTGGRGADVVIDPVGKATFTDSFSAVATNGRWATCGALTGTDASLNLAALYSHQIRLIGSTGGSQRELVALVDMIARKKLRVPVEAKFDLREAADALRALGKEERFGKVLMVIRSTATD